MQKNLETTNIVRVSELKSMETVGGPETTILTRGPQMIPLPCCILIVPRVSYFEDAFQEGPSEAGSLKQPQNEP